MSTGVDDEDWTKLTEALKHFDEQREKIIKSSRDVQRLAKQSIFALHRGDMPKATSQLAQAEALISSLLPIISEKAVLRQGAFSDAMEEYSEASIFRTFLREGRLATSSEIPLAQVEEYLGGVLDFTGEVNRYSIHRAIQRDVDAVRSCHRLVEAIMGKFLQFDLRNSSLRKKYDGLKYVLQRIENALYEQTLVEAMGSALHKQPAVQDDS